MTTTTHHTYFSSDIPFSLFKSDSKQGSLHDLTEESKTFLWHQFMLDVLIDVPRSPADIENVIAACRLVNEYDSNESILLSEDVIKSFQITYTSETAINWYTRDTFLYRAFNKACRMLDTDVIVLFHPVVKDLHAQLKQLYREQLTNGTLKLPLTVFRSQKEMGAGELEKIKENVGGLISMHTFLSTTLNCAAATDYIAGADPNTAVLFQITVNKTETGERMNIFANISQQSKMKDEREVLFDVSSVFKIVSVTQEDFHWFIELESTSCIEDSSVQTFRNEVQTYLYQNTGKQIPLIVFKQLFTIDSLSYARPLVELMRFFLVETIQLFLVQMYKKEGRMKKLIDDVPDLHQLIIMTSEDVICPNSRIIGLLFDILQHFLYPKDNKDQNEASSDNNDNLSLLCFGGFLLMTGDLLKAIRYFRMLLENESIGNALKPFIHSLLAASYAVTKEKDLASESIQKVVDMFQPSTVQRMTGWFSSFIASSCMTMENSDSQIADIMKTLEPSIKQEQSDNMVEEKMRLVHWGHICFEQNNFVEALNHWEEAVEIESHMPSSAQTIYNGAICVQIAAAYFRVNNKSNALHSMEKAIKCLVSYYPSTHQMFATLHFIHGYYLMHNDKPAEAIECLKKSLENPHFFTNQEFCAFTCMLLASASVQSGDVDSAEGYCHQARTYSSTDMIRIQSGKLLKAIPQFKMFVQRMGRDSLRQMVGGGLQFGQQIVSQVHPYLNPTSGPYDEALWTPEKLIDVADHYRHRQDNEHAGPYYRKALDKMTEIDSKSMWNVYRKILRMDNASDQYWDCFIEQFSKYDDDNPNHFLMIATLQIILYKLSLSQNEYKTAFDCLISSALMAVKLLFHQTKVDSQCISDLLDDFFHHELIARVADILTKLIEGHSTNWTIKLQQFLSVYMVMDEVAAIIHHATVDSTLAQIKSKYNNNPSTERIFRFLDILLQFLRQSITTMKTSPLSFTGQVVKFFRSYKDDKSPWFYFIKALESLCIDDNTRFFINIDRFRFQTVTFERYRELKEKLSLIFERFNENQLYSCFKSFAKTL